MKNRFLYVILRWILLFLAIIAVFTVCLLKLRQIVFITAKSEAENIILNASNKAIINVLKRNDIKYDDISVVTRDNESNITGIEIDTSSINLLKSQISEEMYKFINKNGIYTLKIPLGTLLNYEYTSGYGPKLKFKMELAHSEFLDYECEFKDAGINNVLHRIIIKINVKCSVLAAGSSRTFTVKNEALAAQTVIAGKIPESFTNVEESDKSDIADDIFNYRD